MIPGWIAHEGFVLADWLEPDDFQLEPWAAEAGARHRWVAARVAWLNAHPDVADALLGQLRAWSASVP